MVSCYGRRFFGPISNVICKAITLMQLAEMFPNDEAAREWFEAILWPTGDHPCPACGSVNTCVGGLLST